MVRLSKFEIESIKDSVYDFLPEAEIYLYGSRTDSSKRGGDIDLLIYSNNKPNSEIQSKIYWSICEKIGEQKIDILYSTKDPQESFIKLIKEETVRL